MALRGRSSARCTGSPATTRRTPCPLGYSTSQRSWVSAQQVIEQVCARHVAGAGARRAHCSSPSHIFLPSETNTLREFSANAHKSRLSKGRSKQHCFRIQLGFGGVGTLQRSKRPVATLATSRHTAKSRTLLARECRFRLRRRVAIFQCRLSSARVARPVAHSAHATRPRATDHGARRRRAD
jgi:hypothetical protein